MSEEMTNMRISKRNRERLSQFGFAGESFDDALNRVLTIAEKQEKERRKLDPHEALSDLAVAIPA